MMVPYAFEIDEKMKAQLEELADEGHRTLPSQIRMILEEWLEKEPNKRSR